MTECPACFSLSSEGPLSIVVKTRDLQIPTPQEVRSTPQRTSPSVGTNQEMDDDRESRSS